MELLRQKKKMEIKAETFVLKKYENEKSLKFLISKPIPMENLSQSILQGKNKITAAIAHDKNLITGDTMGDIKVYSLEDQKLIYTLPCPPKIKKQINALDIDKNGHYIFAGFSNGNIAFFELASQKCKLINNTAHTSPLLNIKIVEEIDKKTFRIFSSDEDGNVLSIIIKEGILHISTGKVETICEKEKFPIFLIHPIKFKENEIKYNNFIKDLNRNIILGDLQNIRIYSLFENKIKKKYTFEKPVYIKDLFVPDIAVGLGKDPTFNQSSEQEDVMLRLLFAVSWDKVINLCIIPILENKLSNPMITGHYVNDTEII
jgi:WD40 repeat protein